MLNIILFISRYIAGIGISIGVAIAFYNVVARYIFNDSLTWASELSIYLFLWSTFFGATYCFEKNAHISIDLLLTNVSKPILKLCLLISSIICIIYLSAISYYGYEYLLLVNELEEMSIDLDIPMWTVYIVIPISFAFSTYVMILKTKNILSTNSEDIKVPKDDIGILLKEANIKSSGLV